MSGRYTQNHQPEVLRAQHLGVIHDFTLVRGDLQRGEHVVHSRQVGGRAGRHAVELPLEDVETGPPCDMGALGRGGSHDTDTATIHHWPSTATFRQFLSLLPPTGTLTAVSETWCVIWSLKRPITKLEGPSHCER